MDVEVIKKKDGRYDRTSGDFVRDNYRVAAYARVSTDMEEQQTSFESQQKYYLDKIMNNPKWSFVEVYADEGISGTQAFKRENFMRMIKDAQEGKIDLILTKSISRFARNTLDTLKYVRLLKGLGVGIYFEEENINTLDMAGELLLTVLSSVAQQESETISSHVRLGFKMKRERGEIVGFSSCYGYYYNSKTKKMYINEKEAKIVRYIFSSYLEGYGAKTIGKMLQEMKVLTPTGKTNWCESTIINIIRNEKYKGDVLQGKTFTADSITHKRLRNKGEEDKYYIKEHHEPIVSPEDFDKAQEILNNRTGSRLTGRRISKKFTFSGRFRCGFCGKSFVKKSLYKKRPAWDCISVAKQGRKFCPESKLMHEDVIKSCFMEAYRLLTSNDGLAIETFLNNIKEASRDMAPIDMKKKIESERDMYKSKMSKLIDLFVDGNIDQATFDKKQNMWQTKIENCNEKIAQLNAVVEDDNKVENGLNKIKVELLTRDSSNEMKGFDEDLFEALVDYGIIGGYNEKGEKENYMIRFICKTGFNLRSRDDITEDVIVNNNNLKFQKESIYTPIIDFVSNQHFFVFDKENDGLKKNLITKVRVRVEVEKK